MNNKCICQSRTCQFRIQLKKEEVLKREIPMSQKGRTCEFCGSKLCKGFPPK